MSVTIKVSDLLKIAQDLTAEKYEYVQICESESDPDFEIPASIHFSAYENADYTIDYEPLDDIELPEDYTR